MQATGVAKTADGRDLAFCKWGPEDGSPVFHLHGTPGSRYFRHVGGMYERLGLRVITFDRPGYGLSTRSAGRTVAQGAGDVAAVADHLGLTSFSIVGESGGGPYALAAAAAMPDRVVRCATVFGVGPRDAPDLDVVAGVSPEDVEEWRAVRTGEWLSGPYYQQLVEWVETLNERTELPPLNREMLLAAFREGLRPGPHGFYDDLFATDSAWGFDLADATCPTTVMIARDDVNVPPAQGQWLAAHLPNAEELWIDGDHFGPRDVRHERLLAWLVAADSPGAPDAPASPDAPEPASHTES
jgi:pimeloyl-ACP methyl ester carboxylesterase